MTCQARQYSDQMSCGRCALVWDMNDPEPPPCLTDEEAAAVHASERQIMGIDIPKGYTWDGDADDIAQTTLDHIKRSFEPKKFKAEILVGPYTGQMAFVTWFDREFVRVTPVDCVDGLTSLSYDLCDVRMFEDND